MKAKRLFNLFIITVLGFYSVVCLADTVQIYNDSACLYTDNGYQPQRQGIDLYSYKLTNPNDPNSLAQDKSLPAKVDIQNIKGYEGVFIGESNHKNVRFNRAESGVYTVFADVSTQNHCDSSSPCYVMLRGKIDPCKFGHYSPKN